MNQNIMDKLHPRREDHIFPVSHVGGDSLSLLICCVSGYQVFDFRVNPEKLQMIVYNNGLYSAIINCRRLMKTNMQSYTS